jgi:hypothetical protein
MASELTSLTAAAAHESSEDDENASRTCRAFRGRNDDLTVCEDLELGPYENTPPVGDPLFNTIEPNSRINLK